jgi:hypothetical protein
MGNAQMMYPGGEYEFPGSQVFEIPMAQFGGAPQLPASLADYLPSVKPAPMPSNKTFIPQKSTIDFVKNVAIDTGIDQLPYGSIVMAAKALNEGRPLTALSEAIKIPVGWQEDAAMNVIQENPTNHSISKLEDKIIPSVRLATGAVTRLATGETPIATQIGRQILSGGEKPDSKWYAPNYNLPGLIDAAKKYGVDNNTFTKFVEDNWEKSGKSYKKVLELAELKFKKKKTGGEQMEYAQVGATMSQPFIRPDFFTPQQIRQARIDAAKDRPLTFEGRINEALGNPKERAADLAQAVAPRGEGPVDNVRHTVAGMYTADAIANQLSPYPIGPTTVVPKIAGFVGSNLAGLAHEAKAFIPSLEGDYRNIPAAARTTAEDVVNNFVGSALSLNPFMTQGEKEELIVRLSDENYLPDGYEQMNSKHPKNLYVKKEYGGDLEEFGSGGLKQWFAEKWVDVKTGKECGRSGKDKDGRPYPACRPSRRVNSTTPKTASEMSSSEKAKFKSVKTSGKRIPYNHRRAEMGGSLDFESPVTAFEYMINPEYRYQLGGIATAFTPLMVAAQAKLSSLFDSDEPATKSAPKPVDWTQMKRPDQIKYGIDQIVALEPENKRKALENLLEATAYMENRYGADPRAYGRSYTSSFMSIDPIALKDMFTGRGNKGTYNAAQQSQIENFKRLNLPTDQKQFDARLRKDDPVAAMAAARYRYAMSPKALPDPNNPQQMFDYWLTNYNGKGILKHQSREQAYKEFLKGYKLAIGND